MAIFKTYDGVPIEDIYHDHKVEDTQATRKIISAATTELFSTSTAVLTYYSKVLTPVIDTEVSGSRNIMVFSVNESDINGNLVLKMSTSTPLVSTKEYLLVLEPIEDTNTKTNIISMNFGTVAPYNFKNAVFISEDIIRPVLNYGTKITYMYKIRPQQDINSIIVYLYTISKVTGTNKKQLFKISLREAEYQEQMSTAIVTKEETGFMSAEDKNKLEKINTISNYIESKLANALFYAKNEPAKVATLITGQEFATKVKSIGSSATTLVFTNSAIPNDKIESAEVVSSSDSKCKAYMYLDSTTIYISPEEEDVIIQANENSSNMFNGCSLSYFDVSKLDTSKVTNMSGMFGGTGSSNTSYRIIGLNSWNTSKVTNMSGMFAYCGIVSTEWSIGDLSNWNTSNVTDMSRLFKSAGEKSTEFNIGDLSNWNTSNVTDMHNLFEGAGSSATTFNIGDLGDWNTSKVTDMSSMFSNCPAVSSSITIMNSKTTSYSNMFNACSTADGSEFIVKYIDEDTKNIATQMVATKSDNSNVHLLYTEQLLNIATASGGNTKLTVNCSNNIVTLTAKSGFENFNGQLKVDLQSNTISGQTYRIKIKVIDTSHNVLLSTVMSGNEAGAGAGTWSTSDNIYTLEFTANKNTKNLTLFNFGFYITGSNITSDVNIAEITIYTLS